MRFPGPALRSALRRPGARAAAPDPDPTPDAPRPKLILHAGTPKTGTTAIQYALSENRARLYAERIWYPPISDSFPVSPRVNSARAHFAFAEAVARDTPDDRDHVARFIAEMHARAGDVDRVVLSAETLYRLTAALPAPSAGGRRPSGGRRKTWLKKRRRFLARLASVTDGFAPEVLLYLRRVDRFAESLYAETMVQTSETLSFEKFIRKMTPRFDYRLQIDTIAARFPVRVRSFEAAARAGLIASFCDDAGIPVALPEADARTRPSVSNTAALWIRAAKQANPEMRNLERLHRWHFALLPETAELFQTGGRTSFWADAATRDAFIERNQGRVDEIAFPQAEPVPAPRADWPAARHAEAEDRFAAWRAANRLSILKRRLKRTPPFVLDD